MNTFAAVYVASRIAFNLTYICISDGTSTCTIVLTSGTLAYLRSALYFGGAFLNLHMFIKAGNVLTKRVA